MVLPPRLSDALRDLTDAVEEIETAIARRKAADADRLDDILRGNEEVGRRLGHVAAALRAAAAPEAASTPDPV